MPVTIPKKKKNLKAGDILKMLREENDLTQKAMAEKLNLNLSTYQRYECGFHPLTIETVIKISERFEHPLESLLEAYFNRVMKDEGIGMYCAKIHKQCLEPFVAPF